MASLVPGSMARYIDHTILKSQAPSAEVIRICDEAKEYGFPAVCILPCFVTLARDRLQGSAVEVCTVVDFPLGAAPGKVKAAGAAKAFEDGARELDMVLNVSMLKEGAHDRVLSEIRDVVQAVPGEAVIKVILEICHLTDEEIVTACKLCMTAGADFVKTSTGFGPGGATLEAVKLMKVTVGDRMQVKAAGGIRDFDTARAMVEAGATRIGTSSGLAIIGAGG